MKALPILARVAIAEAIEHLATARAALENEGDRPYEAAHSDAYDAVLAAEKAIGGLI